MFLAICKPLLILQAMSSFGLEHNSGHKIQILQVRCHIYSFVAYQQLGNIGKLSHKMLLGVAESIRDWPHLLTVLDLSDITESPASTPI